VSISKNIISYTIKSLNGFPFNVQTGLDITSIFADFQEKNAGFTDYPLFIAG
jgi:hypothetical protein